jgi:hypothetical protein
MTTTQLQIPRLRSAALVSAVLALCATPGAWAQEKQKVLFNVPAESTKYTQQHAIDVGDAPGHQVRVFELQRTFGKDAPMIGGVRVKESWTRGTTDFTDLNGPGTSYTTYVMENGDKIYSRGTFEAHRIATSDGKYALKNLGAGTITGGTGKFQGIRGVARSENFADPKAGTNESKGELEYWMEK